MIEEKTIGNIYCKYSEYGYICIYHTFKADILATLNVETANTPIVNIFDFSYWNLSNEDKRNFNAIIEYIMDNYNK